MFFDPTQPPVVLGEVLFDCFADGTEPPTQVLGGAPFNVAWHLHAFGAKPLVISRIGADALGDQVLAAMQAHGMRIDGIQRDPRHATGTVRVSVRDGEPSYDIQPDAAYDFIDAEQLPDCAPGSLLYHGTLALRQPVSAAACARWRETRASPRFVDVNLRAPWWRHDAVAALLGAACWVKLNRDELDLLAPPGGSLELRARTLLDRYRWEGLCVTEGAAGAFALSAERPIPVRVAPQSATRVVDTVGAGDGFASVLILGLLRGWPLADSLARAQQFAAAIVGQRGATVSDPAFYAAFLDQWSLSV